MNTRLTIGILTVIVLLLGVFVFINMTGGNIGSFFSPLFNHKTTATIDGKTFTLFVAKSEKDKEIGLSNKSSLAANQGMIFIFDKADFYGFWMKNMKFPIDILYLNKDKIVAIFPNVPNPKNVNDQLPVYTPSQPADTVIELPAGTTEKDSIHVGDSAKISL